MIFERAYRPETIEPAPIQGVASEAETPSVPERSWYDSILEAGGQGVVSALYETQSAVQEIASGMGLGGEDYAARLGEAARVNSQIARTYYRPDPARSTKAAQIVYGVSNGLTKIAGAAATAGAAAAISPIAMPAALTSAGVTAAGLTAAATGIGYGTVAGVNQAQRLRDEFGVAPDVATRAGVATGISQAAWTMIPGAFGFGVGARAVTGAGLSAFAGTNETATIRTILEDADYSSAAEQFDPTDPIDLALNTILGAAGGAATGIRQPGVTYHTGSPSGRRVSSVEVEDAARVRSQDLENEKNLPVDTRNPQRVQAAEEAQQKAADDLQQKRQVQVSATAVDPEKIEAIRNASLKRIQELAAEGGAIIQNRDRSSRESIEQMNSIASAPDYFRLATGHDLASGAPVIARGETIPEQMLGREELIVDAKGQRYNARYAVVEADTVLTSNAIDGTPNPLYGVDGEVPMAIAGNGRITALNEAYTRGSADSYRAELAADPAHGINPDVINAMERPILVRVVRETDLPPDIGDRSNQATTAGLNYLEQAVQDANRIDLSALSFTEDGNVSGDTIRQFVALLPEAERGGLVVNGVPTDAASRRLDAAIFQAAYKYPGLTQLLDGSNSVSGIASLLRAMRTLAPRALELEGSDALDFRPILAEVLNEVAAVRASGKRMSIGELARQTSMGRSPEAQAFLDFLARNEDVKGGARGLVDAFGRLNDFAIANKREAESGGGLFGEAPTPTRLDLMQEFSRITGVPIDDRAFQAAHTLKQAADVRRHEQIKEGPALVRDAYAASGIAPIADAPRFELIEVERTGNKVHRVYGVNGNPNLAVFPDGVEGLRPIPLRLQEETIRGGHLDRHAKDLNAAGYSSVEQAVWDVAKNYDRIYEGNKPGRIVLTRPILMKDGEIIRRGVLYAEFQEAAGAYRVGSVTATTNPEYLKNRKLLLETTLPIRLRQSDVSEARTRGLTGQQQLSEFSIGQSGVDVNSVVKATETAEDIAQNARIRESIDRLMDVQEVDAELALDRRLAMDALQTDPEMRIQDGEETISAAEFLRREEEEADRMAREAQEGVQEAIICALNNNGI